MPDQLLQVLKLCLLVLLYLFFVRVTRVVWVEVAGPRLRRSARRGAGGDVPAPTVAEHLRPVAAAAQRHPAPATTQRRSAPPATAALVVVAPHAAAGRRYELTDELTLGRASGCHIAVEDTYVSQVHARVFRRDSAFYVEDLGSTNGTFLDGRTVSGPALVEPGSRVQVGSTVLELVT